MNWAFHQSLPDSLTQKNIFGIFVIQIYSDVLENPFCSALMHFTLVVTKIKRNRTLSIFILICN